MQKSDFSKDFYLGRLSSSLRCPYYLILVWFTRARKSDAMYIYFSEWKGFTGFRNLALCFVATVSLRAVIPHWKHSRTEQIWPNATHPKTKSWKLFHMMQLTHAHISPTHVQRKIIICLRSNDKNTMKSRLWPYGRKDWPLILSMQASTQNVYLSSAKRIPSVQLKITRLLERMKRFLNRPFLNISPFSHCGKSS